jgi:hypothetical protein
MTEGDKFSVQSEQLIRRPKTEELCGIRPSDWLSLKQKVDTIESPSRGWRSAGWASLSTGIALVASGISTGATEHPSPLGKLAIGMVILGVCLAAVGGLCLVFSAKQADVLVQTKEQALGEFMRVEMQSGLDDAVGKLQTTDAAEAPTVRRIVDFSYLPLHPMKVGWSLGETTEPPECTLIDDPHVGVALSIFRKQSYHLDFDLHVHEYSCRTVEVVVDSQQAPTFYIRTRLQHPDMGVDEPRWLNVKIGRQLPERLNESEWTVHVPPIAMTDSWVTLHLSLPDLVKSTFGTDGWTLDRLAGFRLRDNGRIREFRVIE